MGLSDVDGLVLANEIISLRYDLLQVLWLDAVRDPWVEYGATVGQRSGKTIAGSICAVIIVSLFRL